MKIVIKIFLTLGIEFQGSQKRVTNLLGYFMTPEKA
jgi:hypothetical protein